MEQNIGSNFLFSCEEVQNISNDMLKAANNLAQAIMKKAEIEKEKEKQLQIENKKLIQEINKEKEWTSIVAKTTFESDHHFHAAALIILWELSMSQSNCTKIIDTENTISSIVSFIEHSILFINEGDEKNIENDALSACFGILCNICYDEGNRTRMIENGQTDNIINSIKISKNIIDIIDTYNNTAKQIICFISNASKEQTFKHLIIEIGFVESLTSAMIRFSYDTSAVDVILIALISIYYVDDTSLEMSVSNEETSFLLNTLERMNSFTTDIIRLYQC